MKKRIQREVEQRASSKEEALSMMARIDAGEPYEYVIGEVDFFGACIEVNPSVLIPRVETELLAEKIVHLIQKKGKGVLFDLCTGSGALAIAIKKKLPHLDLFMSDISLEALEVAKKNAHKNKVDIQAFCGDLLEPFEGLQADYIVCNPPYISFADFASLDPSVKNFEPSGALIGGLDGLCYYKRLEKETRNYLKNGAMLFFEIGYDQGQALFDIFSDPIWKNKIVIQDLAGLDRFFFLEYHY